MDCHRNDAAKAGRWRGPLFGDLKPSLVWRDKDGGYKNLRRPGSVTFPICAFCRHVIWDWPHFEEPVPDNAICMECFRYDEEQERRDPR